MKKPKKVEFLHDSAKILRESFLSVAPQEGCALLIGNQKLTRTKKEANFIQIKLIWPCKNIWGSKIAKSLNLLNDFFDPEGNDQSKNSRFLIDPRDQINAQKWARKQKLIILGSAHSHPKGNAIPSEIDRINANSYSLMVIVSKSGTIKAWWIESNQTQENIEVAFSAPIK